MLILSQILSLKQTQNTFPATENSKLLWCSGCRLGSHCVIQRHVADLSLSLSPGAGAERVACSAISSHTQAGLAQTHWHFELITAYSHNPFSMTSL